MNQADMHEMDRSRAINYHIRNELDKPFELPKVHNKDIKENVVRDLQLMRAAVQVFNARYNYNLTVVAPIG